MTISTERNSFENRKAFEDEFLKYLIRLYPYEFIVNNPGILPDITLTRNCNHVIIEYFADAKYGEIKHTTDVSTNQSIKFQCHSKKYPDASEIDDWHNALHLNLNEIIFWYFFPRFRNLIWITAEDLWNLIPVCYLAKEKKYKPLKNDIGIYRNWCGIGSGTAYYQVPRQAVMDECKLIDYSFNFDGIDCRVYVYKKKRDDIKNENRY